MAEDRSILLCGKSSFFRSNLAGLLKESGFAVQLVGSTDEACVHLGTCDAERTLVAIDLHQDGIDPEAILKALPRVGSRRIPAIGRRTADDDPERLAGLKRQGLVWFFDEGAAKHEIAYAIKTLFNPAAQERRQHRRAPAAIPIQFKAQGESTYHKGVIRDLSEGGVFIETTERAPLGARVTAVFQLPDIRSRIEVEGDVVFTTPQMQRKSALLPGVGIKFREVPPESAEFIKEYVGRVLRRMPDIYGKSLLGLQENPR